MVSNEILGLGHVRIALRISTSVQSARPDVATLLLTASSMAHAFPLPPGLEILKIPGVVRSSERLTVYRSSRLPLAFQEVRTLRKRLIRETARAYQPDLVLVDYRPAGVGGELLPTLRALKRRRQTALVLLLRDILDDPALVRARWRADGAFSALPLYDEIWVYGCQHLYDPIKEYRLSGTVARKVRFCGYLDVEAPAASAEETRRALGLSDEPMVLVTIGNGRVGFRVLEAYVRALALLPERVRMSSLVVGGPELPAAQREAIGRQCEASTARGRRASFVEFSPRLLDYVAAADLVVSLAGYNTVAEILSLEKRAVVVPYANGHQEQVLRAALLERRGLARVLHPDRLSPERLAESVVAALGDRPPTRRRLRELGFDFGGLARIRGHVLRLLGREAPGTPGQGGHPRPATVTGTGTRRSRPPAGGPDSGGC